MGAMARGSIQSRLSKGKAITVLFVNPICGEMEVYERWEKGTVYVSNLMSKPVRKVAELSLLLNAIRTIAKYKIGCLVVTKNGEPVGIITEGDILRRGLASGLAPRLTKVGELMSKPLITIGSDAMIESAAKLMVTNSKKRLPVLSEGKLVGIITATDIVRHEPVLVRLLDDLVRAKQSR